MDPTYLSNFIIGTILVFLVQFCTWVICLLLLIKERSLPSILMFTGSTLVSISSVGGLIIKAIWAQNATPEQLVTYQGILYSVEAFFYLIFTIGLILFVLKYFRITNRLDSISES